MTLEETTALLLPIALAMRTSLDEPTYRAYHRMLKDVPAHLAAAGLEQMTKAGMRFFPRAPEIATAAETVRRQQLALHKHELCLECEDNCGWRPVLVAGVTKLERCGCKARHQAKLASMGLLEAIAALPGESVADGDAVYPTLEQLPAGLQKQIAAGAAKKVMR